MEEKIAETSYTNEQGIRLADCICPICMSILVEPVTMPCSHELCRPCFRDTVEQVNFTCPLCRLRISNWARKQTKLNKLINWTKWHEIQATFPEQIRKRLQGEDTDDVLQPVNPIRVCEPGEVREEYEKEVKKHQMEKEEQEKIEKAKSQKIIKEIQEEELREYEKRRQEEERLRELDEKLARKIAETEEPGLHNSGNLADEQARLDEQLARALQEEQEKQGKLKQTQRDEEFARKLQEQLERTSMSMSQSSNKRLTPRSKKNTKIPAMNIETFFKKPQQGENYQSRPCSGSGCSLSGESTKDNLLADDFTHVEKSSPEVSCSQIKIADVINDDSNSTTSPMFLGPSTSKVTGRADVSLVCVEEYNDDLAMEFDENSNSNFKHEPVEDMVESLVVAESDKLSLFDDCTILDSKDLTPSPMAVLNISPPSDVDDETRSNQEEIVSKPTGAFTLIAKTPPTGAPRINSLRSDSVGSTDSISHELSHFRPIVISPRTAARKLADGKTPSLVHSTPKNLKNAFEKGESEILQKSPLLMDKWLSLAQEREHRVLEGSKSVMVGKSVIQENSSEKLSNVNTPSERDTEYSPGKGLSVNHEDSTIMSTSSPVSTTGKQTFLDKKAESATSAESADSLKRSPGKVYRMKPKAPSQSKRKNLTRLLMSENKTTRIDKNILSKIVQQKDDKNRKVEEVKTVEEDFDENEQNMNELVDQNNEMSDRHYEDVNDKEIDYVNRICSHSPSLLDEVKVGESHMKNKDQPSKLYSEEKTIKKRNQTEEKGRRKHHIDFKNCKTIEDMFAKFKKKHEDLKNVENTTNLKEKSEDRSCIKTPEDKDDFEGKPDHKILILNKTLSFKPSADSSSSNKRKCDETIEGQRKYKQTSSHSSPKKTQIVQSPSPKKSKLKRGKTRSDSEPLSPGTLKHKRFLNLQTEEERRLQQEALDRKMALKLQREINREMKAEMDHVNRSRGSESEYQLRSRKTSYRTVVSNLP
ncbi:uncharacterized protein [Antedon mediterranea]|uniref:uncharacterized protein n=1 Tax=Antedon mediterranea TaxID=105859 RepID=UPI003AF58110